MTIAIRAGNFANSLGVNTHISQGFSNTSELLSALNYLGINNIRDGINGSASVYGTLASAGVRLDAVYAFQSVFETVSEADSISKLSSTALRFIEGPNEVNNQPITYNGTTTSSTGSYMPAAELQAALYQAVKADPTVGRTPIIDLTSGGAEPDNAGLQFLTVPSGSGAETAAGTALADYANVHVYPANGFQDIASWGNRMQNELNAQYGRTWDAGYSGYSASQLATLPKVMTEFGYPTVASGTDSNAVDQHVQASNTLNMIMDALSSGYSMMYIYELLDDPNQSGDEASYGLFTSSGAPKLAATAIHNMTSILADSGSNAVTFTTGSLNYSISNLPSTGGSLLFQKSNGAFDLAVWNEAPDWNSTTQSGIAVTTVNSVVNLGETAGTVEVFDPESGATPIQTLHNVSQVTVGLTDHPVIIEIEPNTVTRSASASANDTVVKTGSTAAIVDASGNRWTITSGQQVAVNGVADTTTAGVTELADVNGTVWQENASGLWWGKTSPTAAWSPSAGTSVNPLPTQTLTLRMSEDAWQGDAQFTVSVDGTQVGATMNASTLHSTGDSDVFSLTGQWGAGLHTVAISFINDAYGGSATADRNLYVNSIGFNGTTYQGTTAAMPSNGTDTFSVGGSTPTTSGPADILTLHLAEDAWNGNADFTLSVDGKAITTPQGVTVLHSSGGWENVSFAGNFGAGTHTAGITFTNDAYGGSATMDRNLYVNGIDVNGQHTGSGVTALLSNGTASFSFTTSH